MHRQVSSNCEQNTKTAPTGPASVPSDNALLPAAFPPNFPARGWHAWLPSRCIACRSWPAHGLCQTCYSRFLRDPPRCRCCALALPEGAPTVCGRCLTNPPTFAAACAAVSYSAPWDALVRQFKFHQGTEAARVMAQLMALTIARSQAADKVKTVLPTGETASIQTADHSSAVHAQPELIVPIACSNTRMRERGYNQAWELGKPLARLLGIAIHPHCLKRPQEEGSQTHRTRGERLRALKTAFTVAPAAQEQIAGRHIALVDDVMTTGATLEAAARVLKAAGAARVTVWVFARTPEHRVTR